jgi:general secretion pathway protein G
MNRTAQRGKGRGFTMIEAIVIIVIIGVIAAFVGPRLFQKIGTSKVAVAHACANELATAMQMYIADTGSVPEPGTSLSVLWTRPSNLEASVWKGPYLNNEEQLKDPWGNPYQLVIPPVVNADFDIVSYGADGQPGGEGDNADITNGKK